MIKTIQYLYYKLYCWHSFLFDDKWAEQTTWRIMFLLVFFNLGTIYILIFLIANIHNKTDVNFVIGILGIVAYVILYLSIDRNNKHKEIENKFKNENLKQNIIGHLMALFYMVGSIGIITYLVRIFALHYIH